jgi:hypothetical protein
MDNPKLIITPKTRVGEFLEAYPELEDLLMSMAPAFKKLKNPILRKTVGRVATLQQAAAVGSVSIDMLVNTLRKASGQEQMPVDEESYIIATAAPTWYEEHLEKAFLDAVPIINKGESPMLEILNEVHKLEKGQVFRFRTPFLPAPILEKLKDQAESIHIWKKNETDFIIFVKK